MRGAHHDAPFDPAVYEAPDNLWHHSPGYTMARYGHSRKNGARKLAASGANRLGLSSLV